MNEKSLMCGAVIEILFASKNFVTVSYNHLVRGLNSFDIRMSHLYSCNRMPFIRRDSLLDMFYLGILAV